MNYCLFLMFENNITAFTIILKGNMDTSYLLNQFGHSFLGPCGAGVIDHGMPQYCIFGSTMKMAITLEGTSKRKNPPYYFLNHDIQLIVLHEIE